MAVTCAASRAEASGARRTISSSFSNDGYSIHWYRQRRLSASCTSRVRLDVRITSGGSVARSVPSSGNRHLEFGEQFEEKPFELLVGAVDFVDQQDGRTRAPRIDRLKQRPLDEEGIAVQLAMRAGAIERLGRVENPQFEELTRVIPLVHACPTSSPS